MADTRPSGTDELPVATADRNDPICDHLENA
jgi:hypothetical protein